MTNGSVSLRKAEFCDLKNVSALYIDSWRLTYDGVFPKEYLAKMDITTVFFNWLIFGRVDGDSITVAVKEGVIAGFIAYSCSAKAGHIASLHVKKDFWHEGIGRKLISSALKDMAERGAEKIYIDVVKENARAKKIYTDLGAQVDLLDNGDFHEFGTCGIRLVWNNAQRFR